MACRGELAAGLLLLFLLPDAACSRFVVETGSVSVVSPDDIKGRHDGAIANFGVPNYGASMVGGVVYPDSGAGACLPFNRSFKSTKSSLPVILLLDRGECYFAKKVWNGQQAGAAAVLIADNVDEALITMDSPEAADDPGIEEISIPSALITRSFGLSLKKAVQEASQPVLVKLDWTESMPHPDERVEYELWTNSNDECGSRCDEQMNFVKDFKGHAQILERGGYTLFTPHYITWFCPQPFILSKQCKSQCINNGRYCAPDPEQDFYQGYDGKDVVLENLRQLCVHRVANESRRPWVWWDFVTDFHVRCSMKKHKYGKDCAEEVIKSLGLPLDKINDCMGDPDADAKNNVLETEQDLQVGRGSRGDVTILPTLVINDVQYRGKLERTAVLKAICAGFKESTEPAVCLNGGIETNECLERNGGCWQDIKLNISACKDTFRGRICKCPSANGIQFSGDGYTSCRAIGPARCTVNNGGCWAEAKDGQKFSACLETELKGCRCPPGFQGDGYHCEDMNECEEGLACRCDGCTCKNTWGSYDCKCRGNLLYINGEDTCIVRSTSKIAWFLTILVVVCLVGAATAGYIFYKYRFRSYMDSEIMAIMSQYMPLDSRHDEAQPLRQESSA